MSNYSSTADGPRQVELQKLTQTITKSIQKIVQNVSSMQRMVGQFGTAQDSPEVKQQLHQIRTYTQQLISDTENMINEIGNCKDRHMKIQRDRLVDEFTSALTAFQAVQRKTVDYERNALKQARSTQASHPIPRPPTSNNKSGGGGSNSYNSNGGGGGPFEDNFVQQQKQQQQQIQMQEEIDLQALEEQERSIRELEENIVNVNEVYKKLGSLVYEQGAMVDSIEANVEQTNVFVSEGTDQLKKAHHYKTKVMKKRLYLALFLAILLAVIIMIIHWS